jgi:hypothetical protein
MPDGLEVRRRQQPRPAATQVNIDHEPDDEQRASHQEPDRRQIQLLQQGLLDHHRRRAAALSQREDRSQQKHGKEERKAKNREAKDALDRECNDWFHTREGDR